LVFLYALHDALAKLLPGNHITPCLAESWTESADGLVYEFKLLHEQVKAVEIIDALFRQQAVERDLTKWEALLHQLMRLTQEWVMHAPIAEPAALHGVGPRIEESGVGLIPLFAYFGPYEEMRLKRP
jgi:ABC-type transport system substrate-binding protein